MVCKVVNSFVTYIKGAILILGCRIDRTGNFWCNKHHMKHFILCGTLVLQSDFQTGLLRALVILDVVDICL